MMDVAADAVQPMGVKPVIHGIPTIDTLNKKYGIWRPTTSDISSTHNTTHGSAPGHVVGQGTVLEETVGNYREEN